MPKPVLTHTLLYARILYAILRGTFTILFASFLPKLTIPSADLTNKTAIITGANSGLGLETSRQLAALGATVYLACRTLSKGEEAAKSIRASTGNQNVHVLELDTASLDSVRAFAANWTEKGLSLIHI